MADLLAQLAERWGIELEYTDARGEKQRISADTQRAVLHALGVDAPPPSLPSLNPKQTRFHSSRGFNGTPIGSSLARAWRILA